MNENTKIQWLPIEDLTPYENNAKQHTERQVENIATSLEKYGWQNPVLIDKKGVIIAGHGRVLAAEHLGKTKVPCIYADDLTEKQIKEYRILDNKLNESEWIDEMLDLELPELDFSDFDLDFGQDNNEFDYKVTEKADSEYSEISENYCTCPNCGLRFVPEIDNG